MKTPPSTDLSMTGSPFTPNDEDGPLARTASHERQRVVNPLSAQGAAL
jgi:hypothetical protein